MKVKKKLLWEKKIMKWRQTCCYKNFIFFFLASSFHASQILNFRFVPLHYQPSSLSDFNSSTTVSSAATNHHPPFYPLCFTQSLLLLLPLFSPSFASTLPHFHVFSRIYSWRFALARSTNFSPSIKNKPRLFEIVLTVASAPPPPSGCSRPF